MSGLYVARVYYREMSDFSVICDIAVHMNTTFHFEGVKKHYKMMGAVVQEGSSVIFQFNRSNKVSLDIPREGMEQDGWRIYPVHLITIYKQELEELDPFNSVNRVVLFFVLKAEALNRDQKLKYLVNLNGAQEPNNKLLLELDLSETTHDPQQTMAESQTIFNEAMKAGTVPIRITNVLIQGEAGVGKSSTLSLLLGDPPPKVRHSTSVAKTHPHHCYSSDNTLNTLENANGDSPPSAKRQRTAGLHKFRSQSHKWTNVQQDELKKIIARMISIITAKNKAKTSSIQTTQADSDLDNQLSEDEAARPLSEDIPALTDSGNQKVVTDLQSEIVDLISIEMKNPAEVLGSNWIYIIDSGGQPHFHNLLPHFLHGISAALFVVCLSEPLDRHQLVEYYEDDKPISAPYVSHYTTEENLKFLARSIQSHTLDGAKPNLILIGTFLDKLKENPEWEIKLSEINGKLLNLLQPECTDQLIFCDGALSKLLFCLNALSRSPDEQKIAELLRKVIEEAPFQEIDVPVMWYVLEMALIELAKHKDRLVFSMKECAEVAQMLNIHKVVLVEALKFFHKRHIFHYYHDILPNVVFTSTQVLLDKVTELVKEAYCMRDEVVSSKGVAPKSGKWQKFKCEGIITLEFLECFSKHYVVGIFSPADLLRIFIKHLIITPNTSTLLEQIDCNAEYFIPSLLNMLSLDEVEKHRVITSLVSPLLIRFRNGWPRAGVFCCLQVFLVQQLRWEVVQKDKKPKLVAQNCVMLSPPKSAALVTLIDSFAYIEVHVELPSRHKAMKETCSFIRGNILNGISTACKTLRYEDEELELGFFCPCSATSARSASVIVSISNRHPAKFLENDLCIKCTIDGSTINEANAEHTVWLNESGNSASKGTILLPKNLDIIVATKHEERILQVLDEARGEWYFIGKGLGFKDADLKEIENRYLPNQRRCLHEMLCRRIQGGGLTTSKLCAALRGEYVNRDDLAKEIEGLSFD